MKTETIRENTLKRSEVDIVSDEINSILEKNNTERFTRLRIRYTMEDKILNVCEALGEDTPYTLSAGTYFRRDFIRFSYGGNPYDPCADTEDPAENWSNRIMADMGLVPVWKYKNGLNTLELRSERKQTGNVVLILIALAVALAVGFLGLAVLPENAREAVNTLVFYPIQNVFLNLLTTFAGIMIVLSVSCGIFNMGDVSTLSKVGGRMFRRFIGITAFIAVAEAVICYIVMPITRVADGTATLDTNALSDMLQMIYDIVPKDPISPFTTGNAMQIVLIGIILGIGILIFGDKKDTVKSFAEESNSLVADILTWICKLVPVYLVFVLVAMIWSGEFKMLLNVWKPLVVMAAVDIGVLFISIFIVSVKYKVSVSCILKKLMPTFLVAISTASSLSVFNQTISDGSRRFGVDEKYVKMAHPIRTILYMPGLVTELVIVLFSVSCFYDVEISIPWVLLAIMTIIILTLATPPIPGSVVLILGILFTQMGIPTEAMAIAITCDVFYDFLDTAVNNSMGIMEYIHQADKLGMLDKETLRKSA